MDTGGIFLALPGRAKSAHFAVLSFLLGLLLLRGMGAGAVREAMDTSRAGRLFGSDEIWRVGRSLSISVRTFHWKLMRTYAIIRVNAKKLCGWGQGKAGECVAAKKQDDSLLFPRSVVFIGAFCHLYV